MADSSLRRITTTAIKSSDLVLSPGQSCGLSYEIRRQISADGEGTLYFAVDKRSGEELEILMLPSRR